MEEVIVNRVAKSGIETINLADFTPRPADIKVIDLKDWLFQGLILREADFRSRLEEHDWQQYKGKYVAIDCTADAIIPLWAYMLLTAKLSPFATNIIYGNEAAATEQFIKDKLRELDLTEFEGGRVIINGCSDKSISPAAYIEISKLLLPHVKSLMFGEPCSTVPVYKAGK